MPSFFIIWIYECTWLSSQKVYVQRWGNVTVNLNLEVIMYVHQQTGKLKRTQVTKNIRNGKRNNKHVSQLKKSTNTVLLVITLWRQEQSKCAAAGTRVNNSKQSPHLNQLCESRNLYRKPTHHPLQYLCTSIWWELCATCDLNWTLSEVS